MASFTELDINNTKIDTSVLTEPEYFGNALLEYGECRIGSEIWTKHGLTQQDKEAFEAYQELCYNLSKASLDDPMWFDGSFQALEDYAATTPEAKRDTILTVIVEINALYGIGNGVSSDTQPVGSELYYYNCACDFCRTHNEAVGQETVSLCSEDGSNREEEEDAEEDSEEIEEIDTEEEEAEWYESERERRYEMEVENARDNYAYDSD
jgi:hypothetical protein